jgi:hypothetical protein
LLREKWQASGQSRLTSFVVDRVVTVKFSFPKLMGRVRMAREGVGESHPETGMRGDIAQSSFSSPGRKHESEAR